jgi:murein DD-endopeptidase MepM/ murein hydrolase activator NlpD
LLNAVGGVARAIVRSRSNGPDRIASGPKSPASPRHVHWRAISAARFLAHMMTPTRRSRERAAAQVAARNARIAAARAAHIAAAHAAAARIAQAASASRATPPAPIAAAQTMHLPAAPVAAPVITQVATAQVAAAQITPVAAAQTVAAPLRMTPPAPVVAIPARAIAVAAPVTAPRSRTRASARRRMFRRHVVRRLTSDRTLPIAVALIVLLAAGVSLAPAAAPVGAAQANPFGNPAAVRLTVGGGAAVAADLVRRGGAMVVENEAPPTDYVDDGTLYKPVAVDTTIQSSAGMLEHYTVKNGDTLTSIANRYGVSMMTVWWANKITSKESLKVGQDLVIPPVNGLVVTVKTGDTLETLAATNKIDTTDIAKLNGLEDSNLIVGQVLVLPGAKGAPLPTASPRPTNKPSFSGGSDSGGGGNAGVAPKYNGGPWAWPVIGGGNYISQNFHYGHYGVDIAAEYGSTVVSALAGTVVYAGWANTGCGYTVIIRHINSLYTMYCHNSKVLVANGQSVSRRQPIARIGSTGWATGPHSHFAVSVGYPHESGSYFVNGLKYY